MTTVEEIQPILKRRRTKVESVPKVITRRDTFRSVAIEEVLRESDMGKIVRRKKSGL
jgi:hypothetical protein